MTTMMISMIMIIMMIMMMITWGMYRFFRDYQIPLPYDNDNDDYDDDDDEQYLNFTALWLQSSVASVLLRYFFSALWL